MFLFICSLDPRCHMMYASIIDRQLGSDVHLDLAKNQYGLVHTNQHKNTTFTLIYVNSMKSPCKISPQNNLGLLQLSLCSSKN